MSRSGLVIPDMGTASETAPLLVIAPFEAMKMTIGSSKTSRRPQRGQIRHGSVLDGSGERGLADRRDELARAGFELRQIGRYILSYFRGIAKSRRIEIADHVLFVALGRTPSAPGRSSIGKMPGQQEGVFSFVPTRDFVQKAERPHCRSNRAFGS